MSLPSSLYPLVTASLFLYLWIYLFAIYIYWYYFLDSTYKWHHAVLSFSRRITPSRSIHVAANVKILLFFYVQIIFHFIYTYAYMPTQTHVYMHMHITLSFSHIFIYSSITGHLGWFHLLVVNNAPMNIGVCISFQISVFNLFR